MINPRKGDFSKAIIILIIEVVQIIVLTDNFITIGIITLIIIGEITIETIVAAQEIAEEIVEIIIILIVVIMP
jgi:hypothetical protein